MPFRRERWPKERRSSGPSQRWLRRSSGVLRCCDSRAIRRHCNVWRLGMWREQCGVGEGLGLLRAFLLFRLVGQIGAGWGGFADLRMTLRRLDRGGADLWAEPQGDGGGGGAGPDPASAADAGDGRGGGAFRVALLAEIECVLFVDAVGDIARLVIVETIASVFEGE